ncbi:MAG: hypothetical protein J6K52_04880 [Clostridia bacterium]|nr:hypothetical protein [Clostridia bacterium]MBQ7788616.1 hypothetical protein [Clostridia bacterium]
MEIIFGILAIVLAILFIALCLGIFIFTSAGSLFVGVVLGAVMGVFKGFKSYFSSLIYVLRNRSE